MTKKLLVIIPDHLSIIIQKGEVIPRYYNPGNLFDEVHIMMTNDDKPDPALVQTMVGDAKLFLHNFLPPDHFFRNTFGWQPYLMGKWSDKFLEIVQNIQPHLIRTHNNFLEGYLAAKAKKEFSIPFVTSLHGAWDVDDLTTLKSRIHRFFRKKLEIITLKNADAVICVYAAILRYAEKHGSKTHVLIQNFVGDDYISVKKNWALSNPIKLITVNRQLPEKNPENIIKALGLLQYPIEYTLIGDGVLHERLKQLADDLDSTKTVRLIKSLPNKDVCALYAESDFMISNCHYKGISKTIIEAGLSALPIIINRYRDGYEVEEYQGKWVYECDDTPESYAIALNNLIKNHQEREELAKKAHTITNQNFSPAYLEKKVSDIYLSLIK